MDLSSLPCINLAAAATSHYQVFVFGNVDCWRGNVLYFMVTERRGEKHDRSPESSLSNEFTGVLLNITTQTHWPRCFPLLANITLSMVN